MRQSKLFSKTTKSSKEYDSINATLLTKGGFIDQVMAGVYSYLPLGLRVLRKIENIIRDEMDQISVEVKMPSLSPLDLWEKTGRLETIDVLIKTTPANKLAKEKNDSSYILGPSHEEIITPLSKLFNQSYKDFPTSAYQILVKFRNELRPKSGLLRGREFLMKDMYSFHTNQEDFQKYYDQTKVSYMNVYKRVGLGDDTVIALASGGDFADAYSHEFQTKCESGEDQIFYVKSKDVYYNKEVAPTNTGKLAEDGDIFPETGEKYEVFKGSEVGNIFTLGTKYTEAFDYKFIDQDGTKKEILMGCYGIGVSRLMGVIVEKFNDDKGIVWPESIAPFRVHLLGLGMDQENVRNHAEEIYKKLIASGVEVLFDDRVEASAGEKLGDADLIGCPFRVVVSKKTEEKLELKKRNEKESKLLSVEELLTILK